MKLAHRLGLAILAGVVFAGWCGWRLTRPYQAFGAETFVEFPRGTGSRALAAALAKAGVVRSRWDFLLARALAPTRVLRAGEYRFNRPASPVEVFDRIARGDAFYYTLVVPEGKNMFDIAAAAANLGLFPAPQFLDAAHDPSLVRDIDPDAPTLEGYLFPSTYKLGRHTKPAALCRMMTARFRDAWRSLGVSAPVHRTVTLASLVEKECKLPAERPRVAAVFANRLRLEMALDCDPSTIYAALVEERYRGAIHRSDLASGNPYNTYRHAGLPPGPIANPGLDSMRAVLEPAETDALYFVLRPDGSGAHQFSSSMAAHQAAVALYRRGKKK
ncbi:MAG: endolytic transglycosylase MltG [Bryobacteraceae bacterium]